MLGLGHLGSSSSASASASNLSPLAPPFTVDRSNHNKPNLNANPVAHFSDPSYGALFSSSWPYSHSSAVKDFLADSTRTATVSCENDYGYLSPEPINPLSTHGLAGLNSSLEINPPGTHRSAVNFSPKPVTDSFSYNLGEAKPFYPPYALPVTHDDIPSVALNEPSYDLLSTSDLVHGDGSSQVDYTQNLSGLEYNPQWEGIWSGLPGGEQEKRMKSEDSFFSEETNIASSLASKNFMNQAYGAEKLSKGKEDSAMFPGTYTDVFRRENYVGPSIIGKSDGTSFSAKTHGLVPNEAQAPTFVAFPMFSESHPLVPSPEPPKEPWNTTYGKRFDMFDCSNNHISPSMTKSSPSLVIKPPTVASTFSAQAPVSNQPSFQIGRPDEHTFMAPSSTKEEMLNKLSTNDRLCFEFKARSNSQLPDVNNPNIKGTEYVKSAATSSEHIDHHNPAEDSPCWKKPPTSHFSHFESPEAKSPQHPMKKLQTGNGVNLHESSDSSEMASAPTPTEKEHKSGETVGVGIDGGGAQSLHDIVNPRNGYVFLSESTDDVNSQTSELKLPNLKEDVLSSEMKIHLPVDNGEDAANLATAGEKNVNIIVKALHNLSELILLHCSNDERALNEQDHKALEHVTRNLDACMSRKIQRVSPTPKFMLPQQSTSNTFHEFQVTNENTGMFHGQQRNDDILGKSIEKLQGYGFPKDRNMVQAIKKVLDENLECEEELPSQTLLYKNLWLEVEAEMCAFNYRARFERMKKEMEKNCKSDKAADVSEITAAVKKTSSSNGSSDPKISPKLIHEDDGNKISDTHVKNPPFSSVDNHADDVEASVMARFNILKLRGESNPVDVEEKELADVEVSGKGSQFSGLPLGPFVQHHFGIDNEMVMRSLGNQRMQNQFSAGTDDVEPSVMARLNVLKLRGESNPDNVEDQGPADAEVFVEESRSSGVTVEPHFMLPEDAVAMRSMTQNQFDSGWQNASFFASDWEHVLKDEFTRRPMAD